ncbi:hypothetical protein F2P45_14675 [Massilia sp. CCM 8733]|uniref:Uncharacterized protein n=1 Tax=Massilia mucilaginosa TaxID=2609282 RepID=A0ABX0NTY1_9BURK|nr:hypothetical protein [Massilia mucilaginosa]
MIAGQLLLAYHGCDITTRDDLVSGRLVHLDPSQNSYDWRGPGVYFFEGDCERADLFANASHSNPEKMYTARPIGTPAVVGAILRVQSWLDMTPQAGINEFDKAYQGMLTGMAAVGIPMPENRAAGEDDTDVILRRLDNAVFTFIHHVRANHDPPLTPFQAVRGAFPQGAEMAPKSGFRKGTHIQVALCDPGCVEGWFLPIGEHLLSDQEYDNAIARRDAMAFKRKPRKRLLT